MCLVFYAGLLETATKIRNSHFQSTIFFDASIDDGLGSDKALTDCSVSLPYVIYAVYPLVLITRVLWLHDMLFTCLDVWHMCSGCMTCYLDDDVIIRINL